MESFARNQQQIRQYMEETFTGLFPFGDKLSEMGKRNMAMFEDAMRMFAPFPQGSHGNENAEGDQSGKKTSEPAEMRDLRAKLDTLQDQLDQLLKNTKGDQPKKTD
jgi:polyhydroxyalkanoate synthesis regulator protein